MAITLGHRLDASTLALWRFDETTARGGLGRAARQYPAPCRGRNASASRPGAAARPPLSDVPRRGRHLQPLHGAARRRALPEGGPPPRRDPRAGVARLPRRAPGPAARPLPPGPHAVPGLSPPAVAHRVPAAI